MDVYAEFHKAVEIVEQEVLWNATPTLGERVEMARIAVDLLRLVAEQAAFDPGDEVPA